MSVDGTWKITVQSPMGPPASTVELVSDGSALTGTQSGGAAKNAAEAARARSPQTRGARPLDRLLVTAKLWLVSTH